MVRSIRKSRRGGFTLIEILIVVIILGILAAIVIPQFSSASNDARKSNVVTTVQTLRSQIALYKLQHQDTLPDLITNWDQLTKKTDAAGSTAPATGVQTFGPYMQETPVNSLNGKTTVANGDGTAAAATAVGFVYDYASGAGSGKIWGTDVDGKTLIP
jgi:general secretion pathway protein G